MEIIPIANSPQFGNEPFDLLLCFLIGLCLRVSSGVRKRKRKASYVLPGWHISNNGGIKEPCTGGGGGEVHDMNKKPNILLFHVGTWFSLKFWREQHSGFCPPFSFFRAGSWIISRLAGSSPEVSAFLFTRTGIGLKNPAQSNCGFEVTHITDGAVNIAPTSLGAFLHRSSWRKKKGGKKCYLSQSFH